MTVSSEVYEVDYAGNGLTTAFDVPFQFDSDEDLQIATRDSNGTTTVITTGFTVSGAGTDDGTVTFDEAPDLGVTVIIAQAARMVQETDYVANDAFPAESHEAALDHQVRVSHRLYEQGQRALRVPFGDESAGSDMELPSAAARADKFLAFDSDGVPEVAELLESGTILSASVIGGYLNPQSAAETSESVTPSDLTHVSDVSFGIVQVARYGAAGDGSTDDWAALDAALRVQAAAGGGDVLLLPGKTYKITQSLTIPENVCLRAFGAHGQPDDLAAIIKPSNAVSIAIDDSGANRRGVGIDGIVIDMSDMPVGSTGVLFSGVHQYTIRRLGIYGLPDSTSVGLHLRGDATSGFGTLYGQIYDLNISTDNLDRGIGVVCETVGADKANALLFVGARVAHLTTGWKFIGTGSGIVCINCNSESHSGNGVEATNTTAGTHVIWIGGEVNANGGWGFTGSGGRVYVDGTVMGSNSSGDMDTATLTIGARRITSSAGPSVEFDGVHLRTDKSLIGGATSQTVVASDTITCGTLRNRLTAASPITMSSNPQIADGTSIQLLILEGTSNSNTITLVNGQGLRLAGDCTLKSGDTLTLFYDAGGSNDWVEIGRSSRPRVGTFTNADATPSVLGGTLFQTTGTTTITDFDDGVVGQTIKIKANANITITNNASIIKLAGAANFNMTADDTLTLTMYDDQVWTEDGRSIN